MRKAFEAFVTQDAYEIDNPETIMAIVYLKDVSAPTNSGRSKQTIQLVIACRSHGLRSPSQSSVNEILCNQNWH